MSCEKDRQKNDECAIVVSKRDLVADYRRNSVIKTKLF